MPSSRGVAKRAAWSAATVLAAALPSAQGATASERLPPGASSCAGCHAAQPEPGAPPSLSGLSAPEIAAALQAYRTGARAGTIMPRIAAGFSDKEAYAIAQALGRPETAAP